MRLLPVLFCFAFVVSVVNGQTDNNGGTLLKFRGCFDLYYSSNLNNPDKGSKEGFLFNYARNRDFRQNLGLFSAGIRNPKFRAELAIQAGTYTSDNYQSEPAFLSLFHEAKVGFALNKKNTLWMDMGIMNSYIGSESPIGMDNPTLTRSLAAEASPYYITGLRIGWEKDSSLLLAGYLLNGWQRIMPENASATPSLGTEIKWRATKNGTLGWTTFLGSVSSADTNRFSRYLSNLFWVQQFKQKWTLVLGFDIGTQQNYLKTGWNQWWNTTAILQYRMNSRWHFAARAEYFDDPLQIAATDFTSYPGFAAYSTSFNVDFLGVPNCPIRVEYRYLRRVAFALSNPEFHTITFTIAANLFNEYRLPTKRNH